MSRYARGACCAVALVLGLALTAQMSADDQASSLSIQYAESDSNESAEERIKKVLNQHLKVPLDFSEIPLNEIVDALQEEHEIPIVLDYAALDEVAISPEAEITLNVRNVTLRSALNLMLQYPEVEDLAYVIENDVLLITTKDRADSKLHVRIYRVDDFELYARSPWPGAASWADFSALIDLLTSCVEKNSWHESGRGKGQAKLIEPGMLVVTQTGRVHDQIEELLSRLRTTRKQIVSDLQDGEPDDVLLTQGFRISEDFGKEPEAAQQTLAKSIVQSVDWGDEDNDEVWIRFLPRRILVRHHPHVLYQVGRVIKHMGISVSPQLPSGGSGGGGGGGFF